MTLLPGVKVTHPFTFPKGSKLNRNCLDLWRGGASSPDDQFVALLANKMAGVSEYRDRYFQVCDWIRYKMYLLATDVRLS